MRKFSYVWLVLLLIGVLGLTGCGKSYQQGVADGIRLSESGVLEGTDIWAVIAGEKTVEEVCGEDSYAIDDYSFIMPEGRVDRPAVIELQELPIGESGYIASYQVKVLHDHSVLIDPTTDVSPDDDDGSYSVKVTRVGDETCVISLQRCTPEYMWEAETPYSWYDDYYKVIKVDDPEPQIQVTPDDDEEYEEEEEEYP